MVKSIFLMFVFLVSTVTQAQSAIGDDSGLWEEPDYIEKFVFHNYYYFRTLDYSITRTGEDFVLAGVIDGGRFPGFQHIDNLHFQIVVDNAELKEKIDNFFKGNYGIYSVDETQLTGMLRAKDHEHTVYLNSDYQQDPNIPKPVKLFFKIYAPQISEMVGSRNFIPFFEPIEEYIKAKLNINWNKQN